MESNAPSTYPRECYADAKFWDDRFSEEIGQQRVRFFDWYMGYAELREFLPPAESINDVLMIGCGNSRLPEELVKEHGFRHVCCIDLSTVAIGGMAKYYMEDAELRTKLEWLNVDATKMGAYFNGRRFDLIIEKGTLDAIMCSSSTEAAVAMLNEIPKVIEPNKGCCMLVSHNRKRDSLLLSHDVSLRVRAVRRGELSSQSMLVNILRSKLGNEPLCHAMKSTVMVEAMKELREQEARKRLRRFLKAFRKSEQGALSCEDSIDDRAALAEDGPISNSVRRDHCWIYFLSTPSASDNHERHPVDAVQSPV